MDGATLPSLDYFSELLPDPVPEKANQLIDVWKANNESIKSNEASVDAITLNIDSTRHAVLEIIYHLR